MNAIFTTLDNVDAAIIFMLIAGIFSALFFLLTVVQFIGEAYADANHAPFPVDDSSNSGSPTEWDEGMGGWESCGSVPHEAARSVVADQRAGAER